MENIVYTYEHAPTLKAFSKDKTRIRGVMGPIGSGKSSACVMELIKLAQQQQPAKDGVRYTRWLVVRNSYPQLRDTTIKTFHDWIPPVIFGHYKQTDHDFLIDRMELPDGTKVHSEILYRALDRPDQVGNLLSLELTGAWMNEAREIPKSIIDLVDTRINRYPSKRQGGPTWTGMIMDTNPPDVDSWWYKLFEVDKPDNSKIFKQPSGISDKAENIPFLPDGYYQQLMKGKDEEFIKVYVHGEYGYVRDGMVVFPNFVDSLHVSQEDTKPIPGLTIILGFDFGFRNPSCVVCQLTPTGYFRVLREFTAENMGIRQFTREIVKPELVTTYRGFEFSAIGDPAGVRKSDSDERTCFQELREAGIPAIPAISNSLQARYDAVNTFLTRTIEGKPAFQLSPSCTVLRKGFNGGYHYRKIQGMGDERWHQVPEKNRYSHPMDALQYAALYVDSSMRINTNQIYGHGANRMIIEPVMPMAWT